MTDESTAQRDELTRALAELSPQRQQLLSLELGRRRAAASPPPRRMPRLPGINRLPASSGQERLFFIHQLDPESTAYLVPVALRLRGELDEPALRSALNALVDRHEALRTGFEASTAGVTQVVVPAGTAVVDLTCGVIDRGDIAARIEQVVRRPFDLARPPLLRAALWRVSAGEGQQAEWILALCLHHIVVDGWSLGVLVGDLTEIYSGLLGGHAAALAELPLQYADFAVWQREWLASQAFAEHLSYWQQELAAARPLDLATGRARPATRSLRGVTVPLRLPPGVVAGLRRLGDAEKATVFMVLLTALAVAAHRWSGQSDLVVGAPVAGRSRPELEPLVGFFVNTLPLRLTVPGAESCRQLLRRARATCLAGYAHQDVPFEHIVKAAGGRRRRGRTALVQVLLALRDMPAGLLRLPGLDAEVLDLPSAGTDLDLVVSLAPADDGGMSGWVACSGDLFDPVTAAQFADTLAEICRAAAADPDSSVDSLLAPEDLGNQVPAAAVTTRTPGMSDLLAGHPRAGTSAIALAAGPGRDHAMISYQELGERSGEMARWLSQREIGAEDRVGVLLNGVDLAVAIVGILRAGAVCVPLDAGWPAGRLATLLEQASPALTLAGSGMAGLVRAGPALTLAGSGLAGLVRAGRSGTLAPEPGRNGRAPGWQSGGLAAPDPDNAASVLYTAGPGGPAKGVVITYRGLAHQVRALAGALGLGAGDTMLLQTPPGLSPFLSGLLAPLAAGATVILSESGCRPDPGFLVATVARHQITHCRVLPRTLRGMLAVPGAADQLSSLRLVACGGEPLPAELAQELGRLVPGAEVRDIYGLAETADGGAVRQVVPHIAPPAGSLTALAGTEVHILDNRGRAVPAGVTGELHVGGPSLARGYLGQPGQTADLFVPHPVRPGRRLLRTGDLGRRGPDGEIEYLGRLDRQLSAGGDWVDLGRAEAVLQSHPAIAEAAAAAVPGPAGDQRPVAYLVLAPGAPVPAADTLRRFLAMALPPASVPVSCIKLDALPVTPGGKTDYAALPRAAGQPLPQSARAAVPLDPLHEVLTGIWSDALAADGIGIRDDFFDLGGHSLLATVIAAQIHDLFRFEIPLRFFVETPTIAALAEVLREQGLRHGVDVDQAAELILQVGKMLNPEIQARLKS